MRISRSARSALLLSGFLSGGLSFLHSPFLSAQVTRSPSTSPTSNTLAAATSPPLATSTINFIFPTDTPLPSSSATTPAPSPTSGADPGNRTATSCPGPLIENKMGLDIPTCVGACCIKCPAVNSFYEPNKVENVLNAAYVTRQISLAFAIFMAVSYMLLPGKRSQPHISVLFLTVSLSLWYAAFDIMPGVSNACINDFEQSTGHNSRLCGVQGVLIIYLTQTSALWCSLLIYKLHLLAVWRSDIIDRYYGWLTAFCWIFPLAFAIPVAVKNLSQYPGIGFSCLVSTENLNTYLFYPTALYIYPGMLCHAFTVAKMIHIAILSSNLDAGLSQLSSNARMRITTTMQAKRLLRGQWRPALMLGTVMTSLTVFWLFYFLDAHRLAGLSPKTDWVQQWLACVMVNDAKGLSSDETQTMCAKEIAHNIPSIPWFTAAELLLAIIGIVVALVFISKAEFWSDWGFMLSNIFSRGKLGKGSRGRGSPEDGKSPDTDRPHPNQYRYNDPNMKKGTRVGYNDVLPASLATEGEPLPQMDRYYPNNGTQWYDMDDLLDKEYKLPGANLQRNLSYGSRTGMTSASGQQSRTEPPQYLTSSIQDPYSGDILYTPPVQENNAWAPSAHTLISPSKAYLIANDSSDRYVDQPVVPLPVPRASLKAKKSAQQQQPSQSLTRAEPPPVFLSSPTHSPTFAPASLSPMPQKVVGQLSASSPPRKMLPDSVPMVSGVRGSPAIAYAQAPRAPVSPVTSKVSDDPNETPDRIMVASRESITGISGIFGGGAAPSKGSSKAMSQKQSLDSVARSNSDSKSKSSTRTKMPSALDLKTKSPAPPTIPQKSPARQPHPYGYQHQEHPQYQGLNSPSRSLPTSPTYASYSEQSPRHTDQ